MISIQKQIAAETLCGINILVGQAVLDRGAILFQFARVKLETWLQPLQLL